MEATFIRCEWEEIGEDAWALRGNTSDAYDPVTGFGVSHDFFEHGCKLDTIQDEIMAHGAMYWLRWTSGYVYRDGSSPTLKNIGYEFENLVRGMDLAYLAPAPVTRKLDEDVEKDLAEIIAHGTSVAMDNVYCEEEKEHAAAIAEHYAGWFRKGYRWARNYYKAGADRTVWGGFDALTKAVEALESQELLHGDELRISFSPVSCNLKVTLVRQCGMCMGGRVDVDSGEYLCSDCLEAESEVD